MSRREGDGIVGRSRVHRERGGLGGRERHPPRIVAEIPVMKFVAELKNILPSRPFSAPVAGNAFRQMEQALITL